MNNDILTLSPPVQHYVLSIAPSKSRNKIRKTILEIFDIPSLSIIYTVAASRFCSYFGQTASKKVGEKLCGHDALSRPTSSTDRCVQTWCNVARRNIPFFLQGYCETSLFPCRHTKSCADATPLKRIACRCRWNTMLPLTWNPVARALFRSLASPCSGKAKTLILLALRSEKT